MSQGIVIIIAIWKVLRKCFIAGIRRRTLKFSKLRLPSKARKSLCVISETFISPGYRVEAHIAIKGTETSAPHTRKRSYRWKAHLERLSQRSSFVVKVRKVWSCETISCLCSNGFQRKWWEWQTIKWFPLSILPKQGMKICNKLTTDIKRLFSSDKICTGILFPLCCFYHIEFAFLYNKNP